MKIISILIITLSSLMLTTEVNDFPKIDIGQEMHENTNEDVIYINEYAIADNYDIMGRAEEVDLTDEYTFLENVADTMNFGITRQIKIYQPEFKGQKQDEFSKFQENVIFYKANNGQDNYIEISFSENELLGECIHISDDNYKDSIIKNEKVKIFEYPNPQNKENVTGRAFFNIQGMNFKIKVYNISHEEFINIVRAIIIEYK